MLMSFTDPQSVTIAGTAISLPRTSVGDNESTYSSSDGLTQLSASHTYGKRTRRVLRIDTAKIAPDVFEPSENVKLSMSLYMVFDLPPVGYTNTDVMAVYNGFKTVYTATSDAMITKLVGGES